MWSLKDVNPKGDILRYLFYLIYLSIMGVIMFLSLTAGKGLEETINVTIFAVYGVLIPLCLIYLASVKIMHYLGYGQNWVGFLHDTTNKPIGDFKIVKNPFYLIMVMLFIFTFLGLIASISSATGNTSLESVLFPFQTGQIAQQVTPTSKVAFAIFSAPAEDLFLIVLMGLLSTGVYFLGKKYIKDETTIYILAFLLCLILLPIVWFKIHVLVSGTSETATIFHFIFGGTMVFMTFMTGSIIPMEVYHVTNNFFVKTKEVYGIDGLLFIFISLMLLYGIITYIGYRYYRNKKEQVN